MLNERHKAARAIAAELIPAEHEVDAAIVRNARMAITVVEERRRLKLPLTAGDEALQCVTQAMGRLVEARSLLVQAHSAFRNAQEEVGLQAYSYGDISECPPSSAFAAPPLKVVA